MKISVQQTDLQRALGIVSTCTKGNITNPLFSSVRLGVKDGCIKVEGSDSVSGVSVTVVGDAEGEGERYFNPDPLSEYLAGLGHGEITFEFLEDKVTAFRKNSKAIFPLVAVSDYPRVDVGSDKHATQVEIEALKLAIAWAAVSVATDDSRPVLTGLFFRVIDKESVQVVGSDGYRLSLSRLKTAGEISHDILIPHRTTMGALKDWSGPSGALFWLDEKASRVCFSGEGRSFYIRQIMGEFPDFTKILPTTSALNVVLDKNELLSAVRQVAPFARQSGNTVQMEIGSGKLRVFTKETVGGNAEASLDAKVSGGNMELAFNYRYLQEYLKVCGEGEIVMSCNGSLSPVQFVQKNQPDFLHIIMPVNLKS